jgi:O-antigen/teichoic acid export membrane protein
VIAGRLYSEYRAINCKNGAIISLKRNLAATYGSQLFMALLGIVMLPFYVAALGVEAYGIVGLYIALQGWLALLDFGLSPTLSRQAARFRGGAVSAIELSALLRFVLQIFLCLAVLMGLVLTVSAGFIVHRWLHNHALADADAVSALRLMAGVLALRFIALPLRGFLVGVEDLQWLGTFNAAITAARSIFVVPAMHLLSADLGVFFGWQIVAGAVEVVVLGLRVRRWIPPEAVGRSIGVAALREHWGFSLAIALTSTLWVAATNADKVILSGLLALRDYAMFSIATVAAGGVLLMIGPFGMALGPRMVRAHAEGNADELVHRYNQTTQLTAIAAFPAALVLALFARQTLWVWTGNQEIARTASGVLSLYALGNGLLAIGGLPLQLQIAAGRMRLHLVGTALFVILFIPMLWWLTTIQGMTGAGLAWLAINLLFVACWVPVAHRRFLPAPHLHWLVAQVLAVLAPTATVAIVLRFVLPWSSDRWISAVQLLGLGAVLMAVAVAAAASLRGHFVDTIRQIVRGART